MSDAGETSARRRSLLVCLAVVLAYVVVGAVAGVIWEWVWSPPQQVVSDHHLFYTDYDSLRRVFNGTGLYAVVGGLASAVMAVVACLLAKRTELLMLAAVIVGSLLAAYTMHAVGVALGPDDPAKVAAVAANGTIVSAQLEVAGKTPYLVWPLVSLFVLSLVFFAWPDRSADRPEAPDGAPAGDGTLEGAPAEDAPGR